VKNLIDGLVYNIKGLGLGLRTPKLLLLGLSRLVIVIIITFLSAGLILYYHQQILDMVWARPTSQWLVWLWHIVSWFLSLLLSGLAAVLSYLVAQLLFSVVIMDWMSRITERMVSGAENASHQQPLLKQLFFLIKQELPRATLPVLAMILLMMLGWLTPLGPLITVVSSAIAVVFLSWDNTDLIPARRMEPFQQRFRFLLKTLPFHLGFGIWFLIPFLNILFLSFAPVGATLYYIDLRDGTLPEA
jgi:CysZ protein